MKRNLHRTLQASATLAASLLACTASLPALAQFNSQPPRFAIQSIGHLPGGRRSIAYAVNNNGQVVGAADTANGVLTAIFWEPDMERLPKDWIRAMETSGAGESVAYDINSSGTAVGRRIAGSLGSQAFSWTKSRGVRPIASLLDGVPSSSVARSINDSGLIVGFVGSGSRRRGFLYNSFDTSQQMVPLGIPDKNFWCQAFGVNANGIVVGEADPFDRNIPLVKELADADGHDPERLATGNTAQTSVSGTPVGAIGKIIRAPNAFVWSPVQRKAEDRLRAAYDEQRAKGSYQSVGHLGGGYAGAFAVSDNGWVAGASKTSSGVVRATLWHPKTAGLVHLGTLGGKASLAWSVNNSGSAVGWSRDSRDNLRAFLWVWKADGTAKLYDLNDLLASANGQWTLTEARDINEKGQIVGRGTVLDPETGRRVEQGFLLTPLNP